MKLKNFCKAKKTVIRLKRQSIEWKKISCWQGTNKQNIQGGQKPNPAKNQPPTDKWANELNRQFAKEVQMANKYMKKCSTFLTIKEMQIKTILRFHFAPVRIAIINNIQ
jgi:hypothetical protein